jgi:hypothetical protein
LLAALAVLAAIALPLVLVLARGDEGSPSGSGQPRQAKEPTAAPAASPEQVTEPPSTPPAAAPDSEVAPEVPCTAIKDEKKAAEEVKKSQEKRAGHDKQAKEAIKAQFEARKKELEERAKTC